LLKKKKKDNGSKGIKNQAESNPGGAGTNEKTEVAHKEWGKGRRSWEERKWHKKGKKPQLQTHY